VKVSFIPANEVAVLGCGRRPHGDRFAGAEMGVGGGHRSAQVVGHARGPDGVLQVAGHVGEGGGIVDVDGPDLVHQGGPGAAVVHGPEVGVCGHDEPGGHREAGPGQLTQVGGLAAHQCDVVLAEVLEPHHVSRRGLGLGGVGGHQGRSCGHVTASVAWVVT
jgi:hypothetical protein